MLFGRHPYNDKGTIIKLSSWGRVWRILKKKSDTESGDILDNNPTEKTINQVVVASRCLNPSCVSENNYPPCLLSFCKGFNSTHAHFMQLRPKISINQKIVLDVYCVESKLFEQ